MSEKFTGVHVLCGRINCYGFKKFGTINLLGILAPEHWTKFH
jgi:hypothetical protein